MTDAASRLRSQLAATGAHTTVMFYKPHVERLEMPEPEALAAVKREPTRYSFDPPAKGVKVIEQYLAPVEKRERIDGQSPQEDDDEIPMRTVFYRGPVERVEMAALDALHALEAHPDQWSTEAPPKGTEIIDKVPKPLEIKPEMLGTPEPYEAPERLGPGGSHLVGHNVMVEGENAAPHRRSISPVRR